MMRSPSPLLRPGLFVLLLSPSLASVPAAAQAVSGAAVSGTSALSAVSAVAGAAPRPTLAIGGMPLQDPSPSLNFAATPNALPAPAPSAPNTVPAEAPAVRGAMTVALIGAFQSDSKSAAAPAPAEDRIDVLFDDGTSRAADAGAAPVAASAQPDPSFSPVVLLEPLKTKGFVILPQGVLMDSGTESRILALAADDEAANANNPPAFHPGRREAILDFHKRLDEAARSFEKRVTAALKKALPNERFKYLHPMLRVVRNGEAAVNFSHVDGNYLTATYTFYGPGTVIFAPGQGKETRPLQAPAQSVSIVSGQERQEATGIPGTWHTAPGGTIAERLILILVYNREH